MGNKKFLVPFVVLFVLYTIAQLNKPTPIDWTVTLSKADKKPFGSYVLFNQLKDIFPLAQINTFQNSLFANTDVTEQKGSSLIIISEEFKPGKTELQLLKKYVQKGNNVLIAAAGFNKIFEKDFKLTIDQQPNLLPNDSSKVSLNNQIFSPDNTFNFATNTVDGFFAKIDKAKFVVLGTTDNDKPNFLKMTYGDGAFYLHAAPLCFTNYFLLHKNNASYTANCLSYLPATSTYVFWDEYYKPGNLHSETPLRFFLNNTYLSWALWLALAGLLLYIFFEMKRRQRAIPVVEPLQNSSLSFVQTVSSVYFNQKENGAIASKKISYFLEYIRLRFFLPTNTIDIDFKEALTRKTGINSMQIEQLLQLVKQVEDGQPVSDALLIKLETQMNNFYNQVK